jgi:uncharacterized protein
MINFLAKSILKHRFYYLFALLIITIFMGWFAKDVELSYNFVRPLPKDDPALVDYDQFLKRFGEDGTVMVMGFQDSTFYSLEKFNDWYQLGQDIKAVDGIKEVLSVANLFTLTRNDSLMKFDFNPLFKEKPKTQAELDSLRQTIESLGFYKGLLYNPETHVTLMMVTFDSKNVNSKDRMQVVDAISEKSAQFAAKHKVEMHHSGMPYIRTQFMMKVRNEMSLFLILAILVTTIVLLVIFRSVKVVAYSMVVVGIGIVWSLGTLVLFGYKITILTGLIPSIITVIGLPNCVFVINKYQVELGLHGDKQLALHNSIAKVGLSNFLANVTTSIGFFVFYFTKSSLLVEFGLVAAINVMATFTVAMIFIPIILSFLAVPKAAHTVHLTGPRITAILNWIDYLVHNRRKTIYTTIAVLTIALSLGIWKVNLIGHVVDDLPQRDPILTDLRFFEKHFHGVMPFEVAIDTKEENGIFSNNAIALYKIKAMQKVFEEIPEFSKPISIVEALKFGYQSYRGGKERFYVLPVSTELNKMKEYTGNIQSKGGKFATFLDSTKQHTRVSFQMADCGSQRMKEIIKEVQPKVDSIFPADKYKVSMTGNSLVFLKGNDYLFHHLFVALSIAIVLILILGMALFRSVAIIVLSKLPCLIPLAMTAGIMGYFGINFKPSTILIFSIAFGLSSDGTIYILTEYWNQLRKKDLNPENAVSRAIQEVGVSMIYTAAILFVGFAIFAASKFGGTAALGVLMSITIAVALFTNLLLLPSILLSLEGHRRRKNKNAPIHE